MRTSSPPHSGAQSGEGRPQTPARALRDAVEQATSVARMPLVLAVSGGRDSMALLHAMVRWGREAVACVATFDHGTGPYASAAVALVVAESKRLRVPVVHERIADRQGRRGGTEAAWRAARWEFLSRVASAHGAQVATAHTRDDQAETVVMRALRGAGARGLAGLAAESPIVRPWLRTRRATVAAWVADDGLAFLEDPANQDRRFLRVRVRHELLPALERASPGFTAEMLALGDAAATWRLEVEAFTNDVVPAQPEPDGGLSIAAAPLREMTDAGLAIVWPVCVARLGIPLDWRGTRELSRFTRSARRGARVQVAGGAEVICLPSREGACERFLLRRTPTSGSRADWTWSGTAEAIPVVLGGWRWEPVAAPRGGGGADVVGVPSGGTVIVRPWAPGDRIRTRSHPAGRRLTRYFTEMAVPLHDRSGWPVVECNGELVAVPGICRRETAPIQPGGLDYFWYRCAREPR